MGDPLAVTIKNNYKNGAPRTYSVVTDCPTINDGEIQLPELKIPVCFKITKVSLRGEATFNYFEEYYGFVGELKKNWNQKDEIAILIHSEDPVRLGSATNNGSWLNATFENDAPTIMPNPSADKKSKSETFTIECIEPPPEGKEYVVGLAQKFENNKITPVAAVPYKYGKAYKIKPGQKIYVRMGDEPLREVLETTKPIFPVDFFGGKTEVTLTENDRGEFSSNNNPLEKASLGSLHSAKPVPRRPRPPQQPRPYKPKGMEEVEKEGFKSKRQLLAYKFLRKYNESELQSHHDDALLRRIALSADEWGRLISNNDNLQSDVMDDLLILALYDCVLLLDNSSSMDHEPERIGQLIEICENIVEVESAYDNTANVKVEFLNGDRVNRAVNSVEEVRNLIEERKNFGRTNLGGELKRKILNDRVYALKPTDKLRPLIVGIITDGRPEPEDRDQLKIEMQNCKKRLKEHPNLGPKHVLFQISQVGNDRFAKAFLQSLKQDPDLKRIVHCTSYLNLDIDDQADELIEKYAPAIQRLAGAALADLRGYRDESWASAGVN